MMIQKKLLAVGVRAEAVSRASGHQVVTVDTIERPWSGISAVIVDERDERARSVLEYARRDLPEVARLVLPDRDVRSGARLAHAVVDEDEREIRSTLERTCALAAQIATPAVRELIGSIDAMPPLPSTYWSILELAARKNTHASQIAEVVERDPVIALQVLQCANSVGFGASRKIGSIQQAVSMLGVDIIAALVASVTVFSSVDIRVRRFSLDHFASYSLLVARLARQFVPDAGDHAFAAGLFHDLGKLVIANKRPNELSSMLEDPDGASDAHERTLFGCDHADLGAFVLDQWGLPSVLVEAVAYHHRPSAAVGSTSRVLAAVHAAEGLVGAISCGEMLSLDHEFLERAGAHTQLARWEQLVRTTIS